MRTTVDLPAIVHQRAQQLARSEGQSLSATIADLTVRGLAQLDAPVEVAIDPRSEFPTISIGRIVTSDDVATLIEQ